MTDERKAKVAGEVGDILMCLINFCHVAEIDPLKALSEKLDVAEQKYPADRVRGQALKYDEYAEWQARESE